MSEDNPQELIRGMKCPVCKVQFDQSWWPDPQHKPTEEQLSDPSGWLCVVCGGCAQILAFNLAGRVLIKAPPELLRRMDPILFEALTQEQRLIWAGIVRATAQKMALKN